VILILWGISILPIRDGFKIVALVAVLALTVIYFDRIAERSSWFHFRDFHITDKDWDDENDDEETYNYQPQNLSVPFDSLAGKGILKLEAAAGNFELQGLTSDYLSFSKTGDIGNYSLTTTDENGRKKISLCLEKSRIRHTVKENKVDIRLSEKPSWNLDFDIGAAEILMDLRDYRIDTTVINAGASSINIKLGDKNPLTVMTFNAGASSITVDIPKTSACQIKSESFMISKEFEGFTKKEDGIYQTDNFQAGKNKIYMTIKTAISKIEINRY
jgi:hypothetical protein